DRSSLRGTRDHLNLDRRELVDVLLHLAHSLLELRMRLPRPDRLDAVPVHEAREVPLVGHVPHERGASGAVEARAPAGELAPPFAEVVLLARNRPPGPHRVEASVPAHLDLPVVDTRNRDLCEPVACLDSPRASADRRLRGARARTRLEAL